MSAFDDHVRFITDLARRLHAAGVSSARLEGAVRSTARAVGVSCEIWATPTGVLLSFADATGPHAAQVTRMLRLEPGTTDLGATAELDRIAEQVIAKKMDVVAAVEALATLDRHPRIADHLWTVAAFGIAAAALAGLLRTGWTDIAVAGALGLVIGAIVTVSKARPHLAAASEAIAALVATVAASAFAHFVEPISVQTVIVAALIVLMPGLTLTTAVTELATQQLVSGTTRFAGAVVVLLKLTFGSIAGAQLVGALDWTPQATAPASLSVLVEVVAAMAAAFSFAVLFRAPPRDAPLVIASALTGYVLTRLGGAWLGPGASAAFAAPVFLSSLVIAAAANAYGRIAGRPGTLVRVPGIMLMVPGSVGFRGLTSIFQRDYALGADTAVAVLSALVALMAGLLFGSLLVPPRRYL